MSISESDNSKISRADGGTGNAAGNTTGGIAADTTGGTTAHTTGGQTARHSGAWLARAIAGLLGAGAGLTVGEVASAASTSIPSLVIAVSDSVIDSTWVPFWLRRWSIDQLGSAQKPALVAGVVCVTLLVGAIVGVLAGRWRNQTGGRSEQTGDRRAHVGSGNWRAMAAVALPAAVYIAFGIVAGLSSAQNPMSSDFWSGFVSGLAALVAAAVTYTLLWAVPDPQRITGQSIVVQTNLRLQERRRFIVLAGASSVAFLLANVISRAVARQVDVETSRIEVASLLERARGSDGAGGAGGGTGGSASDATTSNSAPTTSAPGQASQGGSAGSSGSTGSGSASSANLPANLDDIAGISPLITPNSDFYRIDTALIVPRLTADSWNMTVSGMVDNPLELNFEQLVMSYPLVSETVTLSCVSNPVGGELVGNAVWEGVRLSDVLEDAGVQPGADQISGRSVDNWASGFPTELAFDGRVAMIAVAMNGEPLPARHGFPARLVIAGLYGYVSATKWLRDIHLTTWEGFDSYWVPRGWAKRGPIRTQSRIDVPRGSNAALPAGQPLAIAGVAWAPHRRISQVEVRIDDQPWAQAELSRELSTSSWRQWVYRWDEPTPGNHTVVVRATDGDGETQTQVRTPPAPSGATGWHTKSFRVA